VNPRPRDDAKSDALLVREIEAAGWHLWWTARLGDRVIADSSLEALARRIRKTSEFKKHKEHGRAAP
jgi:hypothetical protein